MAWAYKTSSYADNGAGALVTQGFTTTVTLGAAIASGDRIVLAIMGYQTISGDGAPTYTVTDNVNSGSYTEDKAISLTTYPGTTNQPLRHSVFSKSCNASGTPVITVTLHTVGNNGQCNIGLQVAAYTGLLASDPGSDVSASNTGTSGTTADSGATSATTAASELVIGSIMDGGENKTLSAGSGFTARGTHQNDGGKYQGIFEDKDSGGSGSTPNATATYNTAPGYWGAIAVVYKLVPGAAPIGKAYGARYAPRRAAEW